MISTGMQLLSLPLILNGLKKCLCWKAKNNKDNYEKVGEDNK